MNDFFQAESVQKQFTLREVCEKFSLAPHNLLYWSEHFPGLKNPDGSTKFSFSEKDLALVERIKKLLYVQHRTLEEAKQIVAEDPDGFEEAASEQTLNVPSENEPSEAVVKEEVAIPVTPILQSAPIEVKPVSGVKIESGAADPVLEAMNRQSEHLRELQAELARVKDENQFLRSKFLEVAEQIEELMQKVR